ncbi:hypothetical protein Ga0466249_003401 [Sporomusaceae bacterium BoRhaA]|uniref:hypothetical protein n=1 Tax=Pelorhabdus rhamnosifermentans TaxID=2772457 RepID=UPI001C05F345|nr:hypothetical protein [Pelorhabdus rhamnosifermentans]MBU2702274.1 hypothetical protein [Pelorhabdus rhamnosifermentans]
MNEKKILIIVTVIIVGLFFCVSRLLFWLISDDDSQFGNHAKEPINYGEYTKYVDISDVIKEAFTTDKGYTGEISKHISKDMFENIHYKYACMSHPDEFKKPIKIDLSLKEIYQTKDEENGLIYVDMIYTIYYTDATGKEIGGGEGIHVTYTVRLDKSGWCIIGEYEKP